MIDDTVAYRPRAAKAYTGVVWVLAAFALVATAVDDVGAALRLTPLALLAGWAAYLLLWQPAVVVSDGGVRLINLLRTVDLPWPAIERIDTRWALTLHTAYGTYASWAATAPSRATVVTSTKEDTRNLPKTTYIGGSIRPGDLSSSQSGQAAAIVRARWEKLRDAGYLDSPVLEKTAPTITWHAREVLITIVAVAAVVASALIH